MLKRLIAIAVFLFATALPASAWRNGAASSVSTKGMLLNVAGGSYFSGTLAPWLNLWKGSQSNFFVTSSTHGSLQDQAVWNNGTYLTANGELKSPVPADLTSIGVLLLTPASQVQYTGTSFNNYVGQQFDVTWSGCANPNFVAINGSGSLGTGGTMFFGSNSGMFTPGAGYSNFGLAFNPNSSGCSANPPTNIKVFLHKYATNVANGEVTNPDWRADAKKFAFLRLMVLVMTTANGTGISDSSQLAPLSYSTYGTPLALMVDGGASVSSGVLTTTGNGLPINTEVGWQNGTTLVCAGCTNVMTISGQLTGSTGNAGTYSLTCTPSCNTISTEGIYGVPPLGQNQLYGPKGGIGPDLACAIANEVGTGIEYVIPPAATNQFATDVSTALKACTSQTVKYSFSNENWNVGFLQFQYLSALGQNKGFGANSSVKYAGYRAAEIFNVIRGVYGTDSCNPAKGCASGSWLGSFGSHMANPSFDTLTIQGAQQAIADEGLPALTKLATQVDVAPYTGDFYSGVQITGITASATPTVTSNNTFTNGQVIKLFVSGGTMATALNNQYATVSSASSSSFQINISTAGLTYGSSGLDFAMDATLFKMADQSTTLNISTPATYPTKYSFFAQQMSKAILTGSASDASYGTLNVAVNSVSNQSLLSQHALIDNSAGLQAGQYEGGNSVSLAAPASRNAPPQLNEFFALWQFDPGVTGDTTNTEGGIETQSYNTSCSFAVNYSSFPAQYDDMSPQSQFGPWGALRFLGDEANIKWQAEIAFSAKGPCVDPTPAATWTVNYNASTDHNFNSGGPTTLTCPYTAPSNGLAIVALTWTDSATITSVVIDGGAPMTQDSNSPINVWPAAIFSQPVLAGTHTVTATWGSGATFASCYALTVMGLTHTTAQSSQVRNDQHSGFLSVAKGSFIIAVGSLTGASTFATDSTQSGALGNTNVTTIDNHSAQASGFAYWTPGPPFSNPSFFISTASANGTAAARYD